MELTNELKERFFALYWGQKVANNDRHSEDSRSYVDHMVYKTYPEWFLVLRPLSSITEEEKTTILKNPQWHSMWYLIVNGFTSSDVYISCEFADYMRSIGVAWEFMGIPVWQWVEWGVVKLKTE